MVNRLAVLVLLFFTVFYAYDTTQQSESKKLKTVEYNEQKEIGTSLSAGVITDMKVPSIAKHNTRSSIYEYVEEKYKEKMQQYYLNGYNDLKQWYVEYKQLISSYSYFVDPPETIYEYYSYEELQLLYQIVEAEVTGSILPCGEASFESKVNVASVILNRVKSDEFKNTISEVITEKNQFSTYKNGRYSRVSVTEDTAIACEFAFEICDTTNGALYFDSTNGNSWADKKKDYIFTDSAGHAFYK